MRTSQKTDFRSRDIAKNNFSGIDISQGLDLEPSSLSPYFLLLLIKITIKVYGKLSNGQTLLTLKNSKLKLTNRHCYRCEEPIYIDSLTIAPPPLFLIVSSTVHRGISSRKAELVILKLRMQIVVTCRLFKLNCDKSRCRQAVGIVLCCTSSKIS